MLFPLLASRLSVVVYAYVCSRQVALGIEIGLFYSARFLLLGSIWESIALHVANNVIAMCIPIKDATTFSHPLVLISRTFLHLAFACKLKSEQITLSRCAF
jgi:membrane protease YdiL (CAAX protease family)